VPPVILSDQAYRATNSLGRLIRDTEIFFPAWGDVYRARHYRVGVRLPDRTLDGGRRSAGYCSARFGRAWITGVNQYMLDLADPSL
jgi:hypothetical protein